jgi:hypothetical protein
MYENDPKFYDVVSNTEDLCRLTEETRFEKEFKFGHGERLAKFNVSTNGEIREHEKIAGIHFITNWGNEFLV